MSFIGNLVLFAAVKGYFANRSRTDKVIVMVRVARFLTHGVEYFKEHDAFARCVFSKVHRPAEHSIIAPQNTH